MFSIFSLLRLFWPSLNLQRFKQRWHCRRCVLSRVDHTYEHVPLVQAYLESSAISRSVGLTSNFSKNFASKVLSPEIESRGDKTQSCVFGHGSRVTDLCQVYILSSIRPQLSNSSFFSLLQIVLRSIGSKTRSRAAFSSARLLLVVTT